MNILDPCGPFSQGFQRPLNKLKMLGKGLSVGPGNLMNKDIVLFFYVITTHIHYPVELLT